MKFKKMLSLGAVFITLLTSTATTYARDPQGELESYGTLPNMLRVMGWAFDADDMNSKTRVHVYIDGEAGNSKVPSYEIRADKSHKRYNGHGFDQTINVPTNWCGRRTVRLYALNDVGSGTFKQIGTLTVDIPAPNNSSNNNSNNKPQRGYINTQSKNLNLRRTPNGTIIGKLAKNTPVTILQGNSNGWTKVQTDSGQVGYVSSQYVAIGEPTPPTPPPTTQKGYINTQSKNLNLRRTPNGAIIGKLAKNTPVTILQGNSNGWTKVRTDSGQEGYVSSQYVAIGEPSIGGNTINPNNNPNNIQAHLENLANNTSGYRMGTRYNGDGQCRGFANKVYLATFQGVSYIGGYANRNYSASSFPGSHEAGRLFNFSTNDTAAVKRLFQSVKVGAFVQMGRRGKLNSTGTAQAPHSAIVYNIMEDGVQFFEANTDGKNTIKVGTYSWQDLANKNQGFTIYMPNNYALK